MPDVIGEMWRSLLDLQLNPLLASQLTLGDYNSPTFRKYNTAFELDSGMPQQVIKTHGVQSKLGIFCTILRELWCIDPLLSQSKG